MATEDVYRAETQILPLADGRNLAFGIYGAIGGSVDGISVVFYFHGFPSSHAEAGPFHPFAKENGIRLIALDRPGMGQSSFQPNRRIMDYPADVLAIADALSISKFGVLGVSGGTPYVLACWHSIPRSRLIAAGICSGLFPSSLGLAGMLFQVRLILTLTPWITPVVSFIFNTTLVGLARDDEHPERFNDRMLEELKSRPAEDRAVIDANLHGLRSAMLVSARESLRPGGQGAAWDGRLLGSHWGFELSDLEVKKGEMVIWHGTADVNVPVAMAEKAAALMPGSDLRVAQAEGHASVLMHKVEEIMSTMKEMMLRAA
jgi:pimeloyl-ACP methyl ester carboxylesterase